MNTKGLRVSINQNEYEEIIMKSIKDLHKTNYNSKAYWNLINIIKNDIKKIKNEYLKRKLSIKLSLEVHGVYAEQILSYNLLGNNSLKDVLKQMKTKLSETNKTTSKKFFKRSTSR